jgi:hypothetical protein
VGYRQAVETQWATGAVCRIQFYRPIAKSIFPLPPSGLCTWYFYYQDINQIEVKRNAEWIDAHETVLRRIHSYPL